MAGYPTVPDDQLSADGWELLTRTREQVFRTAAAAVIGRTLIYDDTRLQSALSAAGADELLARIREQAGDRGERIVENDGDNSWRFFFATRLSFTPPLAPGIGPASMLSTVVDEARQSFANDLGARGFVDITRGRGQRMPTDGGDRARLTKFTATLPLDEVDDAAAPLDVEGWLAVWSRRGTFRIAGGAYPVRGLDPLLADLAPEERPPTDPAAFREELLDLIRAVE